MDLLGLNFFFYSLRSCTVLSDFDRLNFLFCKEFLFITKQSLENKIILQIERLTEGNSGQRKFLFR